MTDLTTTDDELTLDIAATTSEINLAAAAMKARARSWDLPPYPQRRT